MRLSTSLSVSSLCLIAACGSTDTPLAESRTLLSESQSVTCNELTLEGNEGPLIMPPGNCYRSWADCSNGARYWVTCYSGGCSTAVQFEDLSGYSSDVNGGHCATPAEAIEQSNWEVAPSSTSRPPLAMEPCEPVGAVESSSDADCTCMPWGWACPDVSRGCDITGSWSGTSPAQGEVKKLRILNDQTWYWSSNSELRPIDIVSCSAEGPALGIVGTWQLDEAGLHLTSRNQATETRCGETASYDFALAGDCSLTLTAIGPDPCERRATLLDGLVAMHD